MTLTLSVLAFALALAVVLTRPLRASAHCDTMAGPTAQDGLRALETGNIALALRWVDADAEDEVRAVFEQARVARELGGAAQEVADRWFVENLVRVHRAGEGASYTGLLPLGAPVDERVAAADEAVERRDLAPLTGLVPPERWEELSRRFARLLEHIDFDDTDVAAGRAFIAAYVSFFKYAEGHDHDHDHHAHALAGHAH